MDSDALPFVAHLSCPGTGSFRLLRVQVHRQASLVLWPQSKTVEEGRERRALVVEQERGWAPERDRLDFDRAGEHRRESRTVEPVQSCPVSQHASPHREG